MPVAYSCGMFILGGLVSSAMWSFLKYRESKTVKICIHTDGYVWSATDKFTPGTTITARGVDADGVVFDATIKVTKKEEQADKKTD
jgi:predicted type IV restriction endonuclease